MADYLSMDQVFINKLTKILDVNIENENFGVEELAKEAGLSRSQLHRRLQSVIQKTTSQFIREYRLHKAMELLKSRVATASEIAYRVGFGSPTYFNTCFKDFFGYPPGEVRFHHPDSGNYHDDLQDPRVINISSRIKRKKYRMILYSIMGFVILLAISLLIYPGTQDRSHGTSVDTPPSFNKERSIAVLPFINMSGDPALEYISNGMTDAIISRLTRITSIKKVVPFTTMSTYKDSNKGIKEIAKELGVTHLLEGNLQMSGDTVKISLRLIDGSIDMYNWSDDYRAVWNSADVFRMQAKVAENVARNMKVALTETEVEAIRRMPTGNREAYNLYLQAEFQMQKYTDSALKLAIPMYEKAIALDPNFIESYIGLAHLWDIMGWWGFYESRAAIANSRKFMEKVLEMDPENELIENQLYAGLWWFEWDFEKVETYFQKRLADGSLHQSTQMIFYALDTERIEEGYDAVEKALMESPNEAKLYAIKGLALYQLNKKQEVFKLMEDAGPLYGDNWLYNMRSAKLYYLLGHYDKSRHLIPLTSEESLEDEDSEVLFFNALFHNMDQPGSKENRFLNALILKFDKSANGSPAWTLANYYCVNGDYDKSFYWLQKSYDHHEVDLTSLYGEPFLEPLKQDPRFKELCNKVGLSKVVLR